jgi:hypothetical protein
MSIDRVNIQTPNFTLRTDHIRGGQLQDLLFALRRSGETVAPPATPTIGSGQVGPGTIQPPAARFPQVAPSSGVGEDGGSSPAASGFAPGGSDQLQSLDTNGMVRMIVELLERLLQAVFQMLGQGGGAQGTGTQDGGCGGADGSGGPSTCGHGSGMPAPPPGGSPSAPPSGDGSEPVPPRATPPPRSPADGQCGTNLSGRSRARPPKKSSLVRRFLRELGKGAAAAAPALVPGGAPVKTGIGLASRLARSGQTSPRPSSTPFSGSSTGSANNTPSPLFSGGSFEDRLFTFLAEKVRESESNLDSAMQQSAGGSGGDSQTLVAQRVQQLVQKRSELIETFTNTLKTLHESSMAVDRNVKS